jgi:hypothetical protein
LKWVRIRPGDVVHVPGGAKHAFGNETAAPAVMIIVSTSRIARFFREVGAPVSVSDVRPASPPSTEIIRYFVETAGIYGYWNADPEENARIGISLPPV